MVSVALRSGMNYGNVTVLYVGYGLVCCVGIRQSRLRYLHDASDDNTIGVARTPAKHVDASQGVLKIALMPKTSGTGLIPYLALLIHHSGAARARSL